jgi:hypothetical protein
LIDPFYNGILLTIVLVWLIGLRSWGFGRLFATLARHMTVITVLLWVLFISFASAFVLQFGYFEDIHDIDEAVDAATHELLDGVNPYAEEVVPRFTEKYSPSPVFAMGPYNYMPLDLIVYTCLQFSIGGLGAPVWFVLANLAFSAGAMYVLSRLLGTTWKVFVPLAGIVMLFYSFDNASLTLLLMVLAVYVREKGSWHPGASSIFIMGLATLTKIYAALPLAVLLLFDLQRSLGLRNWRKAVEVLVAAAAAAVIAIVVMYPFGVSNVLDAALFFHTSADARADTSAGGTILAELAAGSPLYAWMSAGLVGMALIVAFWVRDPYDRVLLVTVVFLLVSVKSSLAPLTVAGLFLMLRLRDLAAARRAGASVKSSTGGQDSGAAPSPPA